MSGTPESGGVPDDDLVDDGEASADANDAGAESERRMRRALREIRREGWKVAAIYAAVDAALVTLLVNLALSVAPAPFLPERLPIPDAVLAAIEGTAGIALAEPTVAASAVVGVAVGLLVFVVEFAVRVRRPLVEQFEAANAGLRESLRTARDAVEDGASSRMALRLYDDVVAELREASSVGLVDLRRVSATVLVVLLVSLATIHLATVDLQLAGGSGDGNAVPGDRSPSEYGGLQDPSSVLGDPEDVEPGEQNLDAVVDTSGSGDGDGEDSSSAYEDSGFLGSDSVERQRAGFTEPEQLEDAALIREYNTRIREGEDG